MYTAAALLMATLAVAAPQYPNLKRQAVSNNTLEATETAVGRPIRVNGVWYNSDDGLLRAYGQDNLPCNTTTQTAYTCALGYKDRITQGNWGTEKLGNQLRIDGVNGNYIDIIYDSHFTQCEVEDPVLISSYPVTICPPSSSNCVREVSWTTQQTDTTSSGFKLGSSATLGGKIGPVNLEVTASAEYNENWSSSHTDSVSYKETIPWGPGVICSWSSYQMVTKCQTNVVIQSMAPKDSSGNLKLDGANNLCEYFPEERERASYFRGLGVDPNKPNMMCNSAMPGAPDSVRMDVNDGAVTGDRPWTLQACNW